MNTVASLLVQGCTGDGMAIIVATRRHEKGARKGPFCFSVTLKSNTLVLLECHIRDSYFTQVISRIPERTARIR